MRRRSTLRYAVKTSDKKYASIISMHHTLGEAYKSLVKAHTAHFKNHAYPMAQDMVAIIATEAPDKIIRADIAHWANLDVGPPSKKRLPLPIVVHQWNHKFSTYLQFGQLGV